MQDLGYKQNLYILPFDHRASLAQTFGYKNTEVLSVEQKNFIKDFKMYVYQGFKDVAQKQIPLENAAILCDEEFGSQVLRRAKQDGFKTILTIEKSGTEYFEFDYGNNYAMHIEKFEPDFTKVLIKYNPSDSLGLKEKQKTNLKIINDYSHKNNYKFMLEALVPATREQLVKVEDSQEEYDKKLRSGLTAQVITELQNSGIEPDVWKLEGFSEKENYDTVVSAIRQGGRKDVAMVILGRGGTEARVDEWLETGAKVSGVVGFAIGRTVFWDAWEKLYRKEMSKEDVVRAVADNFIKFYKIFTNSL